MLYVDTEDEYLYMKHGTIFTEEGYIAGTENDVFWKDIQKWEDGWELSTKFPTRNVYELEGTGLYSVNSTLQEVKRNAAEKGCTFKLTEIKAPDMLINCIMDKDSLEGLSFLYFK